MAFLTRNEQTLIAMISSDASLSPSEKDHRIREIKYNARLRQDGYRKPVRVFLSVMAKHLANKMMKSEYNVKH